jgi:L-2-hydroxyglutarate oxidase LhgO
MSSRPIYSSTKDHVFEVDATTALCQKAPVSISQQHVASEVDVDVVIVGAGLSGLKAAVDVQKTGFSCAVLEAIDWVGGKTLSVSASSEGAGVVDIGAAWINDTNQSYMYAMAKKYEINLEAQRTEGFNLSLQADGSVIKKAYGDPDVCVATSLPIPLADENISSMKNRRTRLVLSFS